MNEYKTLVNQYYGYNAKIINGIDLFDSLDSDKVIVRMKQYLDTLNAAFNNLKSFKSDNNLPMFDFSNYQVDDNIRFIEGKFDGDVALAEQYANGIITSITEPLIDAASCKLYELAICILHNIDSIKKHLAKKSLNTDTSKNNKQLSENKLSNTIEVIKKDTVLDNAANVSKQSLEETAPIDQKTSVTKRRAALNYIRSLC